MKHESYHELLALRLYGELDANDERRLARHLAECEECALFARDLEATLGAVKTADERLRRDELPADWDERLRAATRPPRSLRPLVAFVAGLAAGLLVTWTARPTPPPSVPVGEPSTRVATSSDDEPSFVARTAPPPRATTPGQLGQLRAYIGR